MELPGGPEGGTFMGRRKIFLLAALAALVALVNIMPAQANVCGEVYQATPECTEGCITAAEMAALLNISETTAADCLEGLKNNGRLNSCTPSGGGQGYCRP
jgi:hypothetical protein